MQVWRVTVTGLLRPVVKLGGKLGPWLPFGVMSFLHAGTDHVGAGMFGWLGDGVVSGTTLR